MKNPMKKVNETKNHNYFNEVNVTESALETVFWGVRGTMPTPNLQMMKYGGETPCVEVMNRFGNQSLSLVFDAGSGIIKYGENAILRGQRVFHLFLTHMHYDHMIGLLKFFPLFRADCEIHIYGQAKSGMSLRQIFEKFFSAPFFPVEFSQLPCVSSLYFHEITGEDVVKLEKTEITVCELNHPQQAIAFRVWDMHKDQSVVYATDHEFGSQRDVVLEAFIKETDMFIFDTTFSENVYKNYKGWGHSTPHFGANIAEKAKVSSYFLFHHDPASQDKYLEEQILPEARKYFKNSFLCTQYQSVSVSALRNFLNESKKSVSHL